MIYPFESIFDRFSILFHTVHLLALLPNALLFLMVSCFSNSANNSGNSVIFY